MKPITTTGRDLAGDRGRKMKKTCQLAIMLYTAIRLWKASVHAWRFNTGCIFSFYFTIIHILNYPRTGFRSRALGPRQEMSSVQRPARERQVLAHLYPGPAESAPEDASAGGGHVVPGDVLTVTDVLCM